MNDTVCTPMSTRRFIASASSAGVNTLPAPPWEISPFWQYAHRSVHPEKNSAPVPRVPEIGGSSHRCGAILPSTISSPSPQNPFRVPRSAPHIRGHNLHSSFSHLTAAAVQK